MKKPRRSTVEAIVFLSTVILVFSLLGSRMGGGNMLDIPGIVNSILPGFVPFVFLALGYLYLENGKKASSMKLMLIYLAIIVVGVLLSIW